MLVAVLSAVIVAIMLAGQAHGLRGITERDANRDEAIRFNGHVAVLGEDHTISAVDTSWPQDVTFTMEKDSALLIRVEPLKEPASFVMEASTAGSPRVMRTVNGSDDLRSPVFFWTNRYWLPMERCNATGCPKIRIRALRGTLGVMVQEKR